MSNSDGGWCGRSGSSGSDSECRSRCATAVFDEACSGGVFGRPCDQELLGRVLVSGRRARAPARDHPLIPYPAGGTESDTLPPFSQVPRGWCDEPTGPLGRSGVALDSAASLLFAHKTHGVAGCVKNPDDLDALLRPSIHDEVRADRPGSHAPRGEIRPAMSDARHARELPRGGVQRLDHTQRRCEVVPRDECRDLVDVVAGELRETKPSHRFERRGAPYLARRSRNACSPSTDSPRSSCSIPTSILARTL